MATMFPTPLPAAVAADAGREAERRVYGALARLLDPEHAVFYSVAWLTRATGPAARDGEADFVIAHSDLSVLVLEVKGGQIGHDQMTGEWHSTDRHDHRHPIRDPFAQATSSHHALEAKLRECWQTRTGRTRPTRSRPSRYSPRTWITSTRACGGCSTTGQAP